MVVSPASRMWPSSSVREVQNQDGAVLLDIRQRICLSMTPVTIDIWQKLKQNWEVDQIAESLALRFPEVPRTQILDDVTAFLIELERKGLLLSNEAPARILFTEKLINGWQSRRRLRGARTKNGIPSFLILKALMGLLAFDAFRLGHSFPRTYQIVHSWRLSPVSMPRDLAEHVCRVINYACIWYPKRVFCLQRSVVTTCLLRSCGIKAEMVIGAQKFPFKTHAWTEVAGHAINERRDVKRLYLVWERC